MGYARMNFAPDCVALFLSIMPSTYTLVGSEKSNLAGGGVTLLFESDDIADGVTLDMTCDVQDAGSTRTVSIQPIRGCDHG